MTRTKTQGWLLFPKSGQKKWGQEKSGHQMATPQPDLSFSEQTDIAGGTTAPESRSTTSEPSWRVVVPPATSVCSEKRKSGWQDLFSNSCYQPRWMRVTSYSRDLLTKNTPEKFCDFFFQWSISGLPTNTPSFEPHHLLQIHLRMNKLCCMEA